MSALKKHPLLSARVISDAERMDTLPRHFGRVAMNVETEAYRWATRLLTDYKGGYWDFIEVNNGAFYMIPPFKHEWKLEVTSPNGAHLSVSRDAAGIIVMLFTLSNLSFVVESETLVQHFYYLRTWALQQPEAQQILQAID